MDQTGVSCIAGRLFTVWTTRKPIDHVKLSKTNQVLAQLLANSYSKY